MLVSMVREDGSGAQKREGSWSAKGYKAEETSASTSHLSQASCTLP